MQLDQYLLFYTVATSTISSMGLYSYFLVKCPLFWPTLRNECQWLQFVHLHGSRKETKTTIENKNTPVNNTYRTLRLNYKCLDKSNNQEKDKNNKNKRKKNSNKNSSLLIPRCWLQKGKWRRSDDEWEKERTSKGRGRKDR